MPSPFNFNQLLQTINSGLQFGSQLLPRQTGTATQIGGLQLPNQLLGAGLLGAGAALDKEPGEVTQARQFLRNRFTSPTALTDQFSGQINSLAQQYQPLLAQQRQRGIEDISQRFAAAFPSTVGAQGGEFGTLARYITDEALPREQAVLGDIGRQLLTEQGNAAKTLLETGKPDPLSQLAYLMGADFLTRGQGGALAPANQLRLGGVGSAAQGPWGAMTSIPDLIQRLTSSGATPQMIQQAVQAFQAGVPFARPGGVEGPLLPGGGFFSGTAALARPPGVEGPLMQSGQFFSGGGGTAGASGGLNLSSALGSAAAGYAAADLASPWLTKQAESDSPWRWLNPAAAGLESLGAGEQGVAALTGAQSGAVAGFLASGGNPVGAVIGGLTGAFKGWSKQRVAEHAMKAQRLSADLQSAGDNQKTIGAFWVQALASAGYDQLDAFKGDVDRITASINDAGSDVLLGINRASTGHSEGGLITQEASRLLKQLTGVDDLDQIPGFRDSYVNYLMQRYTVESGGSVAPASNIGQFGSLLDIAGVNR